MSNHERSYTDPIPALLDGELRTRFNDLLQDTALSLELLAAPDETTRELRDISFGLYNADTLTVIRRNNRGLQGGAIRYRHASGEDAQTREKRSFLFSNELGDIQMWENSQRHYTSRFVLERLRHNWPIDADQETLQALLARTTAPDAYTRPTDIPAEDILELIETFALAQSDTTIDYQKSWDYRDITIDAATMTPRTVQTLTFTVESSNNGNFLKVHAEIAIPFTIDEATVPLTVHTYTTELDDTIVYATYKNPVTNEVVYCPINDLEACYTEVKRVIDALIAEKCGSPDQSKHDAA